ELSKMTDLGAFDSSFMEQFSMMITYAKLTSVNERSMEFSIVLGMMLMWSDPRLAWNQYKYTNISHLYMPLQQLWFPNFHPCESSSITYLALGSNQVAKIFPNGDIRTIVQAEITYSCAFNVRNHVAQLSSLVDIQTAKFPFDVQSCLLCFALNGYDPDEVTFTAFIDPPALANIIQDMSEWRVRIDNTTDSFDYCSHDICMKIIFMLGFLILIGLFFSGRVNLVNNTIGFGLAAMMSMMVVVGILNDSLSKIEYIPCMGLFVLVQIAVTSVAVIAVLLTDKLRKALFEASESKSRDFSRGWRFVRWITKNSHPPRIILFIIFSILHIANFVWLLTNQIIELECFQDASKRGSLTPSSPSSVASL
ncbi:hypothetical protein PENTCL1PPCAC_18881, partial [Pristionchus entomophagus]